MIVYMAVSEDEYELPVAVAGSSTQLARMLGLSSRAVSSYLSRAKRKKPKKPKYLRIEVDDEE